MVLPLPFFLSLLCLQAAFHVVRFAIKLRSFSRVHQLKHVTWDDDGEVKPPVGPTESDDDLLSSEVETIQSSEELQLPSAYSLESSQSCVSAGEEESEEEKLKEKDRNYEDGEVEEVEHMHRTIGTLAQLALEALEGSETSLTVSNQADTGVSCLRVNTSTSPVCGFVESVTANRCTAGEHHLVCSHSDNGCTLSSSSHIVEDASRSVEKASLMPSSSDLVLGFSDLVHLMHACRCNEGVLQDQEWEGTVPADSDKAESNHLLVLHNEQRVETLGESVQCSSQEVATSAGVVVKGGCLKQAGQWEGDSEEERVTALHRARKEVKSVKFEDEDNGVEGQSPASMATKRGMEVCKRGGTVDASAMPIEAWESSPHCVNSCSKVPPPSTDHKVNSLELESSGQTDSSPAASPSALWRNECD